MLFHPSGDGINDEFGPKGVGINPDNYSMRIFNRWDNVVFETNDLKRGWDGRMGNDRIINGIYEYRISLDNILGEKHPYIGSVFIIR